MSEAQWASFVSTMNVGDGVPCTIQRRERQPVPKVPHEPRLAESMAEVRGAADKAMAEIKEAFDTYNEKRTAANRKALESAIRNAPSNIGFAAKSLSEHAENVVQKARADVEAMVLSKIEQQGLDPGEVELPLLEEGEEP